MKLNITECAGVGAGGEEQEASSISILHLPWVAGVVAFLFVGILSYAPFNFCHDIMFSWSSNDRYTKLLN